MTNAEAIYLIRRALAEIEWEQPMEYAAAFDKAIEALEGKDSNVPAKWISCKDRLPETYKSVITYDKYSGVKENWLLEAKPCVSWSTGFHVTHWMPLPEPPKEETGEAQT